MRSGKFPRRFVSRLAYQTKPSYESREAQMSLPALPSSADVQSRPFAFPSDLRPIKFSALLCRRGERCMPLSRFLLCFRSDRRASSLSGSADDCRRARPICGTCNVSAYLYRAGHTDGKRVARTRAEDSVHVLAVLCGKLNGNECLNGSGKSAAVYTPCRART